MNDISNRTLALMLVAAIVVSLVTTFSALNRVGELGLPTGRQYTPPSGRVNLSVETTLSIVLDENIVDFGSGYVNDTRAECLDNATLTAAFSGYADRDDCWVSRTTAPNEPSTGFLIRNDGNVNASVTVDGPHPSSFFQNHNPGSLGQNLTWRSVDYEAGSCASGLNANWAQFDSSVAVCDELDSNPASNEMEVEVQVIIPSDQPVNDYVNASIEFTAVEV